MSASEAQRAGVPNRRAFFRVENGKTNMFAPSDQADWFRFVSVDIGNGDSVGVLKAWQWPDAFEDVTVADLRAVQNKVAQGKWRENAQSKTWVGQAVAAVMHLDCSVEADKQKIKTLLKIWTENGMFVVVEGEDEKRNKRSFVEVGSWADD